MSDSIRIRPDPKPAVRRADLLGIPHPAVVGPPLTASRENFLPCATLAEKFLGVDGDLQRLGLTTRLPASRRAKEPPRRIVRLGGGFSWQFLLELEFDPSEPVDDVRQPLIDFEVRRFEYAIRCAHGIPLSQL